VKFGSFASLRDALVGREVPCRVRGCDRTWLWSKEDIAAAQARGEAHPPKRMCPACHDRFEATADRAVACSRKDCAGTWTWPRMAQLESWVQAHRPSDGPAPPRGLCATCRQTAHEKSDREVTCRLRGCANTWTWSAQAQLAAVEETNDSDPQPPKRLCAQCEADLHTLTDHHLPCRVRGCDRSWVWTRWGQLEALRAGKTVDLEHAPARMCERCASSLSEFKDQELPCRVRGCKHTWSFTARAQLEAQLAGETAPPRRMCASCLERYGKLTDQEVPCKRPACKHTWIWKRGAQLGGKRKRPPARFCEACEADLAKLQDRAVPCETEGCPGTWTWTRAAQLMSGAKKPPHHVCESCAKFIESVQPKEIPCARCSKTIHWSKHNQLLTKLGRWVEPTVCGSCKLEAARGG